MKRPILLVVLFVAACEGDKVSPLASRPSSSPTSPSPTPPTVQAPTVTLSRLVIQEPAPAIGPGQTGKVQAIARFSDGSERDVTDEATWSSTQPQIATVAGGVITGHALGRLLIRAVFQSRSDDLGVVIQPAGTFMLTGIVTEPGPVNVAFADVEVVGRSGQVRTNEYGYFELFGVSGRVRVRASKGGYVDNTKTVDVMFDQGMELEIRPILAPTSMVGNYGMTLTISDSCVAVPADHRIRTYGATIAQTGARLEIRLRDANFVNDRGREKNTFTGKVVGNTVTFEVGDGGYYYYENYFDVQEILPAGQVLYFFGQMETQVAQTMSGNFVGGISFRENNRTRSCSTSNSRLEITRN